MSRIKHQNQIHKQKTKENVSQEKRKCATAKRELTKSQIVWCVANLNAVHYTGISYDTIKRVNEIRTPFTSRFARQTKHPEYVMQYFGRDMIRQR
jgi:hypothetical protein